MEIRLADGMIVEVEKNLEGGRFVVWMPGTHIKLGEDGREVIHSLLAGETISPNKFSLGGRSVESRGRFLQSLIDVGLAAAKEN